MGHIIEIIIFGSMILLSFLLFANPFKSNAKANRWLSLFILLWSSYWLEEIVELSTGIVVNLSQIPVVGFLQFSASILIFLCIKCFTDPNYKLTKHSLLYLIGPIAYLLVLILDNNSSYDCNLILTGMNCIHAISFLLASYIKVNKHQKQIKSFSSNTTGIDLYWLEYIIIMIAILTVIIIAFNIFFYLAPLDITMNLVMLFTVFFVAYNALKQKEIYPIDEKERQDAIVASRIEKEDELPKRKLISDKRLVELKVQLNELMQNQEPYLDTELNLIKLSKLLKISSNHLSYVINTGYDENFYSYVNKHRIEKAKKLLVDKKITHLSIIGIAYESGFSSKTSFNTVFKKVTGLTPSEFKKRGSDIH